jgi:hypothetical protein
MQNEFMRDNWLKVDEFVQQRPPYTGQIVLKAKNLNLKIRSVPKEVDTGTAIWTDTDPNSAETGSLHLDPGRERLRRLGQLDPYCRRRPFGTQE